MIINGKPNQSIVYPSDEFKRTAHISSINEYKHLYKKSIEDPEAFWMDIAKEFYWKSWSQNNDFLKYNFDLNNGPIYMKWMDGMVTNMCYNVVDRVIEKGLGDRVCYHWESNDANTYKHLTYNELKQEVCKFANALKSLGIKKGDRVAIYMSVSIELVIAMLGSARIGAIHSVIFAGFSAEALADRIIDANCCLIVTSDGAYRANKFIPLKDITDKALNICEHKGHQMIACIVSPHLDLSVSHQQNNKDINYNYAINWNNKIDIFWTDIMSSVSDYCQPVWLEAEDPLFILYTSGSTGKPKGMVHTVGGYLLYSYLTFKYVFNYTDGDVFLSTADLGWMAAHTFNVYGALANGCTVVLFEGTPVYPTPSRLWNIIDRLDVNIFYTAPTTIRSLMKFGDHYVKSSKRDSLKVLGTAGEPINPEAWYWFWDVVGDQRCPVVDNYWQTETGGPMITCFPGATPMKPGSATFPFFGVVAVVLDSNGKEIEGPAVGQLAFKKPWPGLARTIDGKHEWYQITYFQKFNGYYSTGDGVRRDSDGYYWMTGRNDDTLNVSGHLLSTVEVETAIVEHRAIAEAAAVSAPHPIKGQCIHVFVVLNNGFEFNSELNKDIKHRAREKIGALAEPDMIRPLTSLPKTKSGKIMRRLLAKVTRNDFDFGDTSTMADQSIIEELIINSSSY
ncbi:acetyl-coenzyme A synthetase, cytoplasmic-like [Oppia nitens]|uniref:acetyl-coenzyme A synthetase, cytoplasmic-like n=1 Tax=Oppia nitens TaxID=1686743 RepID=UPI0023D9B36B|nr:acetyl-coenzyme A synthetase, cytoplasmic-like [Oppia nitens]